MRVFYKKILQTGIRFVKISVLILVLYVSSFYLLMEPIPTYYPGFHGPLGSKYSCRFLPTRTAKPYGYTIVCRNPEFINNSLALIYHPLIMAHKPKW